jgi:hypothetical protein
LDPITKELTTDQKVKRFEEILAAEEKASASSTSSSQVLMMAGSSRWDTALNRAVNVTKGWPKLKPPMSAGRVLGEGLSVKWSDKYGRQQRGNKESSLNENESHELHELREKVAQVPEIVDKRVADKIDSLLEDKVTEKITAMMPSLFQAFGNWDALGRVGLPPIPSMIGSNSNNAAAPNILVTPAANTTAVTNVVATPVADTAVPVANTAAQELNAPAGTEQQSSPSVSCTLTYVSGPSTTAELDAVKVTKRRWLNLHFLHRVTYTLG